GLPASTIGVATIHAEEFSGEEGIFVAAGLGLDGNDSIFLVDDIFGQERDFDLLQQLLFTLFEVCYLFRGQFAQLRVVTLVHFLSFGQLPVIILQFVIFVDHVFEFGMFTAIALQQRNVIEDIWLCH